MSGETSVLSDVIYWLLWAVVWVAPGIVTALIARDRGRPVWRWLVVGVIFSWLALIAIIVLPDKSGQPHVSVQEWEVEKARLDEEHDASEDGGSVSEGTPSQDAAPDGAPAESAAPGDSGTESDTPGPA